MRISADKLENRREFLRSAARSAVLGSLILIGASAARSQKLKGQRCINLGICSNCARFSNCGLPQALSAKLATSKTP
jgi:hypothetical protein